MPLVHWSFDSGTWQRFAFFYEFFPSLLTHGVESGLARHFTYPCWIHFDAHHFLPPSHPFSVSWILLLAATCHSFVSHPRSTDCPPNCNGHQDPHRPSRFDRSFALLGLHRWFRQTVEARSGSIPAPPLERTTFSCASVQRRFWIPNCNHRACPQQSPLRTCIIKPKPHAQTGTEDHHRVPVAGLRPYHSRLHFGSCRSYRRSLQQGRWAEGGLRPCGSYFGRRLPLALHVFGGYLGYYGRGEFSFIHTHHFFFGLVTIRLRFFFSFTSTAFVDHLS